MYYKRLINYYKVATFTMPKLKKSKEKLHISLDVELVKRLRNSKIKASTLINGLLWKHFSPISHLPSFEAHNPEVGGSNPPFATQGIARRSFGSTTSNKDLIS